MVRKTLLLSSLVMILGCRPHTRVGMNYYYPPGSEPPASQYHLGITVHGAPGHAYVDRTAKTVYLSITSGKPSLLTRDYTLTAASLDASVVWDKADDLQVILLDGPTGTSVYLPSKSESALNQLLTLHFTQNQATHKFSEAQLSPAAVSTPVVYPARAPQ
jgi:hypothetical protein